MRKIGIFIICLALLCGCDHGVEWEDHPYEVHWIDTGSNRTLARVIGDTGASIGRVDAVVVAVGSNDNYVVAKQIPVGESSASYYYIDKNKDGEYLNQSEITQGPFTENKFAQLQKELGLPKFSKEFQ